jgi:hypothetical protein
MLKQETVGIAGIHIKIGQEAFVANIRFWPNLDRVPVDRNIRDWAGSGPSALAVSWGQSGRSPPQPFGGD